MFNRSIIKNTSIHGPFSMAMLNKQRVHLVSNTHINPFYTTTISWCSVPNGFFSQSPMSRRQSAKKAPGGIWVKDLKRSYTNWTTSLSMFIHGWQDQHLGILTMFDISFMSKIKRARATLPKPDFLRSNR
jgi:hypothetical protein